MTAVPVIDLSNDAGIIAEAIDRACRESGFFCVTGHGIPAALAADLERHARTFFALPTAQKAEIEMARGGRAWRGWFPLGGEVTNGVPDRKEGIYFGRELGADDPRVVAKLPLHGANLFPAEVPELSSTVLAWMAEMRRVGDRLMELLGIALGIGPNWFSDHITAQPTELFRIFRYPLDGPGEWGVAEHTDYGLLTLLLQDDSGGLQVHSRSGWVDVAPIPDTLVCNIGDMLERMTAGRYRSTPHRVRNRQRRDRLSFPFFYDPSWDARIPTLPLEATTELAPRWDGRSVFDFDGTYGEYLVAKVSKVFPDLVQVI